MKAYGLKRKDRVLCEFIHHKCNCGDWSSKHPTIKRKHQSNRRLKKSSRQLGKLQVKTEGYISYVDL